jgi:Serine hydrolase (FSH1)
MFHHSSISRNNAKCNTSGPFDGIFGFSQGGAIGALMAVKPNLFPGLKFVILSSAPDIHELDNLSGTSTFAVTSVVNSLHFAGLADIVVPLSVSRVLASRFESSQFFEHEQGHCIPTKPGMIAIMASFLEAQLLSKTAASQSSLPSKGVFPALSGDIQLKSTVGKRTKQSTPADGGR